MKLDTANLETLKWVAGPQTDLNHVINISDPKWGHPEANEMWFIDPKVSPYPFKTILDPELPEEERVAMGRNLVAMMKEDWSEEALGLEVEDLTVPGCPEEPDTPEVLTVMRPKGMDRTKRNRVLFMVPGGALLANAWGVKYRELSEEMNCALVLPRYRPAWEARYPAAINDVHAAYKWVVDNADEQGFDPNLIVIYGASSGGHIALASAFRLKRYGYRPRGVVASVPQTGFSNGNGIDPYFNGAYDSFIQNASFSLWLGSAAAAQAVGPEACPDRATVQDCIGYPPTFLTSGDMDPGCSGVFKLIKTLRAANVFVDFHMFGGTSHCGSLGADAGAGWPGKITELAKLNYFVMKKGMRDSFDYDLSRPWTEE